VTIPSSDLAKRISDARAAGAVDLLQIRDLVDRIVLPVNPDEGLSFHALGEAFLLLWAQR